MTQTVEHKKVIGYTELAEILGCSPKYLPVLRRKHPERVPPHTRTSKTKWHVDTVNEWLKDDKNNKSSRGRPKNKYNLF